MTDNRNDAAEITAEITAETDTDRPVGRLRLLPAVTFGLRAAALSRVALPVAMVAASLVAGSPSAGAENFVPMDTTCCPPNV